MAKVGDIVQVSGVNGSKFTGGKKCWGVMVSDENVPDTIAGWKICAYIFDPDGYLLSDKRTNGNNKGWYFEAGEYRVVPEKDVPDWVWVELAKYGLLGAVA